MAMAQIDIKDEQAAKEWLTQAQILNDRTKQALTGLAEDLRDVGNGAEGDLVKQFIDMGTEVWQNTGKIIEGMNGLLTVVNDVLGKFNEVVNGLFDGAKNLIGGIFSH